MTVTDEDRAKARDHLMEQVASRLSLDVGETLPDVVADVMAYADSYVAAERAAAETEAERRLDALIEARAKRDALAAAEQRRRTDVLVLAEELDKLSDDPGEGIYAEGAYADAATRLRAVVGGQP